jgi:hypothetical protein
VSADPRQSSASRCTSYSNCRTVPIAICGSRDKRSNAWRRVDPDGLFPTILTKLVPHDDRAGNGLHWHDHRVLTVTEARRAQGYPDSEVLIGPPSFQWKVIGNSVPRQMALTLGMSLREAWLTNPCEKVHSPVMDDTVPALLSDSSTAEFTETLSTSMVPRVVIIRRDSVDESKYQDLTDFIPDVSPVATFVEQTAEEKFLDTTDVTPLRNNRIGRDESSGVSRRHDTLNDGQHCVSQHFDHSSFNTKADSKTSKVGNNALTLMKAPKI